jgi:osmoprotectant transport system permease protein
MSPDPGLPLSFLGLFGDAIDFIFNQQPAVTGGGLAQVGGPHQVLDLASEQLKVTVLALALSLIIAMPPALWLGHRGRGERLAIAVGNAGRAIPELALIAIMAAVIGVGLGNLTIALSVLGIPPILTNTYVGISQVNRDAVDAARGMGMTEPEIVRKVEVPLAVPTIMSGVRTATINIVATATIAPLAGILTLGDFIIARNVYGDAGVLAGAILVALLALSLELILAGVQYMLTSPGLRGRRA